MVPLRSWLTSYRVQNKLARVISNVTTCQRHTMDLLCNIHWLLTRSHIMFKVATLCYKAYQLIQRSDLHATLAPHVPHHRLRSAVMDLLTVHQSCTKTVTRHFSSVARTVWNGLPLVIHNSDSIGTFKMCVCVCVIVYACMCASVCVCVCACVVSVCIYIYI